MPLTDRECVICSKIFRPPVNPSQKCCSSICSGMHKNKQTQRWYEDKKNDPAFRKERKERNRIYWKDPKYWSRNKERNRMYRINNHRQVTDYARNKNRRVREQ